MVGGICRKDTLARNLRRMLKTWGSIYGYAPETYILPREAKEFEAELEKHRQHSNDSPVIWICKPSSSSQGKNIFLITKAEELTYDCSFVVQRYIANPMLIGGYKYDLRMSAADGGISSRVADPMRIAAHSCRAGRICCVSCSVTYW